jgi:hypothetical protein
MEEKKPMLSFLEKLKQKAESQKTYGGDCTPIEASMDVKDCPNCGAGRAKHDGLTNCAYCGFEFLSVQLTDGIYLKKDDNSNQ